MSSQVQVGSCGHCGIAVANNKEIMAAWRHTQQIRLHTPHPLSAPQQLAAQLHASQDGRWLHQPWPCCWAGWMTAAAAAGGAAGAAAWSSCCALAPRTAATAADADASFASVWTAVPHKWCGVLSVPPPGECCCAHSSCVCASHPAATAAAAPPARARSCAQQQQQHCGNMNCLVCALSCHPPSATSTLLWPCRMTLCKRWVGTISVLQPHSSNPAPCW